MRDPVTAWTLEINLSRAVKDEALESLKGDLDYIQETFPDEFEYDIDGATLHARSDRGKGLVMSLLTDCIARDDLGVSRVVLERMRTESIASRPKR